MTTCAHHGAINRPNSIGATREVLRQNAEVAIVEVDFISLSPGRFVASHDYSESSYEYGETLDAWLRFICLEQRKIIYLDLKARLPLLALLFHYDAQERFDCAGFFLLLNRLADELSATVKKRKKRGRHFNLREHVWVACQDEEVSRRLFALNEARGYGWRMIADVPHIETYLTYYLTPLCCLGSMLQPRMADRYADYDFSHTTVVAIDCRCIAGLQAIEAFVRASNIRRGTTLVLYAFERSVEPIKIDGHPVIMMYNYYV